MSKLGLTILRGFTAHHKLIEALGLLFALGAWTLDWWFVQSTLTSLSRFENVSYRTSDFYLFHDVRFIVQLESAINRSLKNQSLKLLTLEESFEKSWNSSEVRQLWWGKSLNDFVMLQLQAENIYRVFFILNKNNPEWLENFSNQITSLGKRLSPEKAEDLDGIYQAGINLNNLDKDDVAEINTQLHQLRLDMDKNLRNAYDELQEDLAYKRKLYRAIFIIGSAIIMFSKILAWRSDIQKTHNP